MVFFLIVIQLSQLSSRMILNWNYLNKNEDGLPQELVCTKYQLQENQKIYIGDAFLFGFNSLDHLENNQEIQVDYDLLEIEKEDNYFPLDHIIVNSIILKGQLNQDELCSLTQIKSTQHYQISCIVFKKRINTVDLIKEKIYEIPISVSSATKCRQLSFFDNYFQVLCIDKDLQPQLIFQNKVSQINNQLNFNFSFEQQCQISYENFNNNIFLGLFCCIQWGIYNLNEVIIDSINFNQQQNKEQSQLINFQFIYESIFLIFADGIYQFELISNKTSFMPFLEDFQKIFNNNSKDYCISVSNLGKSILNLHSSYLLNQIQLIHLLYYPIKDNQNENMLQDIYFTDQNQYLLRYKNHLIHLFNNFLKTIIDIQISEIVSLSSQNYFFGLTNQNKIILFRKKFAYSYYPYNSELHKFIIVYKFQKVTQCYQFNSCIFLSFQSQITNDFLVQLNEKQKGQISFFNITKETQIIFYKDEIITNIPYQMRASQSNFFVKEEEDIQLQCNFHQYFPQKLGYYVAVEQNDNKIQFFIFQESKNNLILFDCLTNQFKLFQIDIELNDESVIFDKNLFILDRSGKNLYIIEIFGIETNNVVIQLIYQFDDEMKFVSQSDQEQHGILHFTNKNQSFIQKVYFLNIYKELSVEELVINFDTTGDKAVKFFFVGQRIYFIQYQSKVALIFHGVIQQVIPQSINVLSVYCQFQVGQINCILVGLYKDKLYKYLVTEGDVTILDCYVFKEYLPIQPTQFVKRHFAQNKILIATKRNNQSYLLLFEVFVDKFIELKSIIQFENSYFRLTNQYVLYYNINLMMFNYRYYTLSLNFTCIMNFGEKINLLLEFKPLLNFEKHQQLFKNITCFIECDVEQIQTRENFDNLIYLKNNRANLDLRQYLLGPIDDIFTLNSSTFQLITPLVTLQTFQCQYYFSSYCINALDNTSYSLYSIKRNDKLIIYNQSFDEVILFEDFLQNNIFIIISKIPSHDLSISLYNVMENKQIFQVIIEGYHQETVIVQNILMIFTSSGTKLYYVDLFSIRLIYTISKHLPLPQLYHIKNFQYIYSTFTKQQILFNYFQIENENLKIQQFIVLKLDLDIQLLNQFTLSLVIEFARIQIIQCWINDVKKQIEIQFVIFTATNLIIYTHVFFQLEDSSYQLKILNLKKSTISVFSRKTLVFIIQQKYLIISNNQLTVYNLQQSVEYIYPFYKYSQDYTQIYPLNTTHFIISHFLNSQYLIQIVVLQEWEIELPMNNQQIQHPYIQLNAYNDLNSSSNITLHIIFDFKSDNIIFLYIWIISICLILILVLIFIGKNDNIKQQRHQKIKSISKSH